MGDIGRLQFLVARGWTLKVVAPGVQIAEQPGMFELLMNLEEVVSTNQALMQQPSIAQPTARERRRANKALYEVERARALGYPQPRRPPNDFNLQVALEKLQGLPQATERAPFAPEHDQTVFSRNTAQPSTQAQVAPEDQCASLEGDKNEPRLVATQPGAIQPQIRQQKPAFSQCFPQTLEFSVLYAVRDELLPLVQKSVQANEEASQYMSEQSYSDEHFYSELQTSYAEDDGTEEESERNATELPQDDDL